MRIVIVENEREIAMPLALLLQGEGFEDVRTVLSNFHNLFAPEPWKNVRVAFIDHMLGGQVTGLDLCYYLRDNHPEVYRVGFTAVASVIPELMECCDQVLEKPSGLDEIIQLVRSLE